MKSIDAIIRKSSFVQETLSIPNPCYRKSKEVIVRIFRDDKGIDSFVEVASIPSKPIDTVLHLTFVEMGRYFEKDWEDSTEQEFFYALQQAEDKLRAFKDKLSLKDEFKNQ